MTDGKLGKGTQAAYDLVRSKLDFIAHDKDVQMYDELEKMTDLLVNDDLLEAVEKVVEIEM